jgi:hypothetical protein
MELGRTPDEIRNILPTRGDRRSMRWVQYWDFALIAGYAFFFVMAAVFEWRTWGAPAWLAALAAAVGLAAGALDLLEDLSILHTLDLAPHAIAPVHVHRTRNFSRAKWALFGLAELLLAAFAPPLFRAVLGASGLAGLLGARWPKLLTFAITGFALVVLASLVLAIFA